MEVQIIQGSIQEQTTDTIIVNLFEGVTVPSGATGAVDKALNGAISELIANGDIPLETGLDGIRTALGSPQPGWTGKDEISNEIIEEEGI